MFPDHGYCARESIENNISNSGPKYCIIKQIQNRCNRSHHLGRYMLHWSFHPFILTIFHIVIQAEIKHWPIYVIITFISHCIQGAAYLHSSSLGSHGHISSSSCLVDSRWQIKLTSFGLHFLKQGDRGRREMGECQYTKQLWTAPELLRMPEYLIPPYGTKSGDVFSFAIVLQEILYRASPYFIETHSPKGRNTTINLIPDLCHLTRVFL